jgi:thiamine pyrophosphate-dependent acetolactate synthase large subunit-like protein
MTLTTSTATATVSDLVAEVIVQNCDVIFGLMGNGNAFVVSNLTRRGLTYVAARHEAGTVAAADGYYRASGKVGVATVTYGAGFTNALTALAEARMARIPLVLIVGDAPTTGLRLWDIDQTMAARAVGVETVTVTAAGAARLTRQAFATAQRNRVPVILAIPYDIGSSPAPQQQSDVVPTGDDGPLPRGEKGGLSEGEARRVAVALSGAERPLIIAGRGAFLAGAGELLRAIGDHVGALFSTSVMARNLFDSSWDLGIAGGFAGEEEIALMRESDVVLVVGASLNTFQTRYGTLMESATTVIQVDEGHEATHAQVTHFFSADAHAFSEEVHRELILLAGNAGNSPARPTWREVTTLNRALRVADAAATVTEVRETLTAEPTVFGSDGRLDPRPIARALNDILPFERTIVQDGGHFIGWMPQYCTVPDPHALILVGTAFQSIGLGFPAAVGAAHARPDRTTVVVAGDGGGLMALPDMETFIRTVGSGVIVIFNDAAYGAELHQYGVRGLDTAAMLIDEVDFAAVGRAFGAQGVSVRVPSDLDALREWVAAGAVGVIVVDVAVTQNVVAEYMAESVAIALVNS